MSGPGANELLHLEMAFMNSFLEKGGHSSVDFYFFKNIDINLTILSTIENQMESVPEIIDF